MTAQTKANLINNIKKLLNWYVFEGKEGMIVDSASLDINTPIPYVFTPFEELTENQLERIMQEDLSTFTDTEIYTGRKGDFNGEKIIEGIYNYENEEQFLHYSYGIADEENERSRDIEAKRNKKEEA